LHRWIGAQQVVWLPGGGIAGDDTDGHVDQIARFAGPHTVLVSVPHNDDALLAEELRANHLVLQNTLTGGRSLELVELKRPGPKSRNNHPLPCSYANFCLCNAGVLCPTFQDPSDDEAMSVLQSVFPDRKVIGVDCLDLVWGLGALHCLSHEQPLAG
jgi:agmatine deiminase